MKPRVTAVLLAAAAAVLAAACATAPRRRDREEVRKARDEAEVRKTGDEAEVRKTGDEAEVRKAGDEAEVRKVLDEVARALSTNDAGAIERLYLDGTTHVHTDGSVLTKEQIAGGLRSGFVRFESLSRDEVSVRLYGDAAVAVSRITFASVAGGVRASGTYRATALLVRRDGRWMIAGGQATTIARP